jgi:hypothetical protein
MKYLYLFFFSVSIYSQSKAVDLKIISLTEIDSTNERAFTVKYSITNKTDKTIHFILNPDNLIPVSSGSMNTSVYYKLYENEMSFDISGIFTGKRETRYFKDDEEAKNFMDSIKSATKNRTPESILQESKKNILKNILELKPDETKEYSSTFHWNKNRYFKNDVMEYYIDEKEPHYYELHINLMKEVLLSKFSEEEKEEILKNRNFVKGWFTSNKVEINFRE